MTEPRGISKAWRRQLAWLLPPALLTLALLALWQAGVAALRVQPWLLPTPLAILRAGWAARGLMLPHIWQTAQETLLGFAAALAIGLGLGILLDLSVRLRAALYPLLVFSQTVPIVAIAPLLVIWFGYGILPKIIVVALVCFFPIVVNTVDGLRATDPEQINLLRTMGATRRDTFFKVQLPGAMPMIYSGVKVGITYSVVGAILGEWVGASRGIGVFMLRATNSFRTDWVFVSIALTAALSLSLFGLVALVERMTLRWHYAAARQERWEEISARKET
jgi:ABC-type nitrate/sulfonate/bicarbonate transport system permease component